jgi:hypothetical protein
MTVTQKVIVSSMDRSYVIDAPRWEIDLPMTENRPINLRHLWWVGPLTVAAAIVAVVIVQSMALKLIVWSTSSPLVGSEPALFTGVLVTGAVLVFAAVASEATFPVRTFRRIALVTLLLSLIPDVILGFSSVRWASWPLAITFMVMHLVAWAVTVTLLPRLMAVRAKPA